MAVAGGTALCFNVLLYCRTIWSLGCFPGPQILDTVEAGGFGQSGVTFAFNSTGAIVANGVV